MNYIVFDLEWNQCPYGKGKENLRLPFEIIEIGAVKLNQNREMTGEFHRFVRPMVYKKLHFKTEEILDMDMKQLREGDFFYKAVRDFFKWCGEDFIFCTWGNMDLLELQRNMKYYHLQELLQGPVKYYDVQKLFSISYEDGKSRKSLEYGIDYLGMEKSQDFHHALADAYYTAEIFKKLDLKVAEDHFSVDSYQNPKTKEEEIYITFPDSEKYITREFNNKEEAMRDREVAAGRCFLCGKNVRKKIRWFSVNPKNCCCVAICPRHGYLKGKIRMKKTPEGKIYVIKTMTLIDECEMEEIREKKEALSRKRRQKKKEIKSRIPIDN
jgi:inhibitor of KinA sporulation pathway (predicted exonuclease)